MEKPKASTMGVAEPVAQYGLTVKEREIIELLRENPELEEICLKLLGSRKSFKEAFAELQKIPDPEKK